MKRAIPFFISQAVTIFGSQLVAFAFIWYITLESSSGVWVALFAVCSFVPQFLMSFVGGTLADRYSKIFLIIASDAAIALFTLLLALLMPLFGDGTGLRLALLAASILRSAASGIQVPAVNSTIPLLVDRDMLMRANGVNSTLQSVANFAAPAAAGALMTLMSLRMSMLIDVATAVVGIAILSLVFIPTASLKRTARTPSFSADIRDGIGYALSNRKIGRVLLMYGAFVFLVVPPGFLSNLFVARYFGDTYVYLMAEELAGFGGMFLGGLLMSISGGVKNRQLTMFASIVLLGLLGIAMGYAQHFAFYLCMMFCFGTPMTAYQATVSTFLQENTEERTQGRIFGLLNAVHSASLPFGMAVFGPLSDYVSLRVLIVLSCSVLVLFSLAILPSAPVAKD